MPTDNAQLNRLLCEWLECDGPDGERDRRMLAWATAVVHEHERAFQAFVQRVLGQVSLDNKAACIERAAWLTFKLRALFPRLPFDG